LFRVGPTPAPVNADLAERLRGVEPSTVGHFRDRGFAHGLRQIVDGGTAVGTALTVRLADMDATAVHCAVDLLGPGHVLVVDMGGDRERASVGAVVAAIARQRGATGIVVDGMVTDRGDLERTGLSVHARGVSAMTTRVLGVEGDINLPVSIGGVVVHPGQVVVADADGVLFLDADEAAEVAERARDAQERERELLPRLLAGASLAELTGAAALLATHLHAPE
jgi:4-hydroxy-4-methyl-2-oxoglutarate aldolase